jgi:hypothetical protein
MGAAYETLPAVPMDKFDPHVTLGDNDTGCLAVVAVKPDRKFFTEFCFFGVLVKCFFSLAVFLTFLAETPVGAIAGGIAGGVAGFLLLLMLLVFLFYKKQEQNKWGV